MADTFDYNATQGMATGGDPDQGEYTRPSDADAPQSASRRQRTHASHQRIAHRQVRQQWQDEFPYHWSADDLVTRRDTLRFLVAGSGALCLASAVLAITGEIRSPVDQHVVPVARVGELPVNGYKVFNYPNSFEQGILVNLPDKGLVAYSDVCTHLSCAVLYQKDPRQFYCPCHDGRFDAYTGEVIGGPPTRPLPLIELRVAGHTIYALREVER